MKYSQENGVSLLEILVVIGILALLAILIFPWISSGMESANLAKCTSHLRTLWMAQNQYSQEHDGRFVPFIDEEGLIWPARLQHDGYLPAPSDAFFCPSFPMNTDLRTPREVATTSGGFGWKQWGVYSHYGYNHLHLGASYRDPEISSDSDPARLARIRKPGQTVLFLDSIRAPMGSGNLRGSYIVNDQFTGDHAPDPRHRGSVNIVFVDGHVESLKLKDPANPYLPFPDGLGRTTHPGSLWNR